MHKNLTHYWGSKDEVVRHLESHCHSSLPWTFWASTCTPAWGRHSLKTVEIILFPKVIFCMWLMHVQWNLDLALPFAKLTAFCQLLRSLIWSAFTYRTEPQLLECDWLLSEAMSDEACGRPQTLGSSIRAESETGGGAFHCGQLSDNHCHQSQAGGQTFPRRNPHSRHWKEIRSKDERHILSCAFKSITMKLGRNNAHFDLLRLTNHPCCLDVQRDCGFGSYECLSRPIKERKHSCQHALWSFECTWKYVLLAHLSCSFKFPWALDSIMHTGKCCTVFLW